MDVFFFFFKPQGPTHEAMTAKLPGASGGKSGGGPPAGEHHSGLRARSGCGNRAHQTGGARTGGAAGESHAENARFRMVLGKVVGFFNLETFGDLKNFGMSRLLERSVA